MKKMSFLLLLAAAPLINHAQGRSPLRFGIKAGGNLSQMTIADGSGDKVGSSSFGLGYFGGGLMEVSGPAGSKFKGQIELLYSHHTFKNSYLSTPSLSIDQTTTLNQISVPVLAKYFVIPSLSINLGGSVNFNLSGKDKLESSAGSSGISATNDLKDYDGFNTVQVGALAGVTYYIYKGFFVDGRYNYYFGKMVDEKGTDAFAYKNQNAIQLSIGYKF